MSDSAIGAHRFKLGDRVKFTGTVTKQHDYSRTLYVEDELPRCFDRVQGGVPYTEGIIIGRRTVMPGETESMTDYDGYGNRIPDGNQFTPPPGASRRVWLVAFDLRRKPVMCFDEQVQEAEG